MTQSQPESGKTMNVYKRTLGDMEIIAISDGVFELESPMITNLEPEQLNAAIADAYLDPAKAIPVTITQHIIKAGDKTILIDTGAGTVFGPNAGNLTCIMEAVGIPAAAITDLLLTHMHPDHIGGMLNDHGAVFANAAVKANAVDFGFWTSEENASGAPDEAKPFFELARAVAASYGDRFSTFDGETDLGHGIRAFPTPGHTPGHSAFHLDGGSEQMLIWGDVASIACYQFTHPDAGIAFDIDGAAAAKTRRKALSMAAAEKTLVAGSHLPFPGFGHVEAKGNNFAWVPEEWQLG